VKNTAIENVFHAGRKMLFFFDYGDAWSFQVECIDVVESQKETIPPKVLSTTGTFPEQYPDYDEDWEEDEDDEDEEEETNIVDFPSQQKQSDQILVLHVYLSGQCQKLFGKKAKDMKKDSEVDPAQSTWLSYWRCEHLRSDSDGRHLFLFTHATTFFSIIVYQEELDLNNCLQQFQSELIARLEDFIKITSPLSIATDTIKGNPRSLITTMNQIVYEASFILDERFRSYEDLEDCINHSLRSKLAFRPSEEFARNLYKENPFVRV